MDDRRKDKQDQGRVKWEQVDLLNYPPSVDGAPRATGAPCSGTYVLIIAWVKLVVSRGLGRFGVFLPRRR